MTSFARHRIAKLDTTKQPILGLLKDARDDHDGRPHFSSWICLVEFVSTAPVAAGPLRAEASCTMAESDDHQTMSIVPYNHSREVVL